jgi:hypothetical protein
LPQEIRGKFNILLIEAAPVKKRTLSAAAFTSTLLSLVAAGIQFIRLALGNPGPWPPSSEYPPTVIAIVTVFMLRGNRK